MSPKNLIFPKGLNVWSKYAVFFFICFRSKKGLEIRFNDVLVEKEILSIRTKFFNVLKIAFFHAFGQKMPNFSVFRFGQNETRNDAQ